MSLRPTAEPILDAEQRLEGFENLMPFKVHNILLVSSLYDSFILREDGRLNELLIDGASSSHGALLYLASGPHQNADGSWEIVLGLQNADGILGLDMDLHYNISAIRPRGVTVAGISARMAPRNSEALCPNVMNMSMPAFRQPARFTPFW